MHELTAEDLGHLALGGMFLGSGGGGDTYEVRTMIEEIMRTGHTVSIISVDEVEDDWLVQPIGMVGAPTISIEKFPCANAGRTGLRKMESVRGQRIDALMASEIGGSNGMLPMYIAAQTGLPVVDADGTGRAFPELQMVTYNLAGVKSTPTVVADEYGNTVVVDSDDPEHVERIVRGVITSMGGDNLVVDYTMRGHEVRDASVCGAVSLAMSIGRILARSDLDSKDRFEMLGEHLRNDHGRAFADEVFRGKIYDVDRDTRGGFVFGRVRIKGDRDEDGELEIQFKNEYMVARKNGALIAIVPDLICVLERDTAVPICTENLKYGQRVVVFALNAPPEICTPEALEVFGPQVFGIEEPYVALGST